LKPDFLIFDLDGTLVDSMAAYTEAFVDALVARHPLDRDYCRDAYLSMAGMAPGAQFREVLRRSGIADDGVEAMLEAFWLRCRAEKPVLFPEVAGVLDRLSDDGYVMFVSSGGRTDVARFRMATAHIDMHFRHIQGSDEEPGGIHKGPAHFRVFADLLGIPPAELSRRAWLIGDGPHDMQVAREAGMRAIGRLAGANAAQLTQAGADALISDLEGLSNLLLES
jgi:phosphoglycolate phosphatase